MAELILKAIDQIGKDIYVDVKCYKKADVVCIKPDGWQWGSAEKDSPEFYILKIPGVKENLLSGLLVQEPGISKVLQRRAFTFDLDAIKLNPPKSVDDVIAMQIQRLPKVDPNVIG